MTSRCPPTISNEHTHTTHNLLTTNCRSDLRVRGREHARVRVRGRVRVHGPRPLRDGERDDVLWSSCGQQKSLQASNEEIIFFVFKSNSP